jgi:hypothetical protein
MAFTLDVDISKAALEAPEEIFRQALKMKGARLNKQIARGVQQLFQSHLFAMDGIHVNKLGGPRTHFYGDAAKATSGAGDDAGATITIAQQGMRQRVYGGTIRAQNGKYLTIPLRSEAYGKRAREFGDLQFVKLSGGRALLIAGGGTGLRLNKKGEAVTKKGLEEGLAMYLLVPEVTQRADRSLLPSAEQIFQRVKSVVDAAWKRTPAAGGTEGGNS